MFTQILLDFACTAAMLGLSVLVVVLALGAPRTRASFFLIGYFACVAVDTLVSLTLIGWHASLSTATVRWLHVANVPLAYLYGVLLYGYVMALTSTQAGTRGRRELWHLLPYALALVFSLSNAVGSLDTTPMGALAFKVSYHAWVLFGLLYLVMAVRRIYRSRPALEQCQADEAALRLTWLRGLTILLAVSWIWMTMDRFASMAGVTEATWLSACLDGLTMLTLYVLAWFGLRQPVLLQEEQGAAASKQVLAATTPYARSALDVDGCAAIAAELTSLMAREQLYVDSHFDLQSLGEHSGWPPNYVSQALNQGLGQNFFEFVNGFRVAAAERQLADPSDQRTILEIALACGFGSKSTFNAVFKRLTGQTPSQFRRNGQAPLAEPAA